MSVAPVRKIVTAGSITLALALAAPLAAFADPGARQGVPASAGEKTSVAADRSKDQPSSAPGRSDGNPGVGDEDANERKVTLCHATGSQSNPYVLITVSKASVLNGHADHQGREDIIPSFTYTDSDGQTRTFEATGDQSILAAQCEMPADGGGNGGGGNGGGGNNGGGAGQSPDGNPGVGDEDANEREVTICHATRSRSNPYVLITVSKAGVLNGHADHQGREDIIPSFTYTDSDGQTQIFAAQGDQSILAAQCETPADNGNNGNNGNNGGGNGDGGNGNGGNGNGGGSPEQAPATGGGSVEQPRQAPANDGDTTAQPRQAPTAGTTQQPTAVGTFQQPAQTPATGGGATTGVQPVMAPVAAPVVIAGTTNAPAVGAPPVPAPAPGAPVNEPTGAGQGVATSVVEAAPAGSGVASVMAARSAVDPAALPFTGSTDLSVLLALGLGALGLGALASRAGTRDLTAAHVAR